MSCQEDATMATSGRGAEGGETMREEEKEEDEDYIDMDLSSAGPSVAREFEFMSAPLDRWGEPLASPADELFYKGKLLPLHLPPRIQMVEELLDGRVDRGGYSTAPATPYESCRASPANNSRYVSGELNVEEYFQEYAAGMCADAAAAGERKSSWARKLKFVRQLNLGLKLKASKAYLKTILLAANKPPGNVRAADDDRNSYGHGAVSRELSRHGGHNLRAWRRNPFGHIRSNRYIIASSHSGGGGGGRAAAAPGESGGRHKEHEQHPGHRRSFSSVMVRYSSSNRTSPALTMPPSSCTSSSSSSCSTSASSSVRTSSDSDGAALRRSSSASSSSEAENPIQGLIAYCKRSQQLASVRKSASDAGFRFLSSAASKIAAESDGLDELIENLQRMKM